MQNASMWIQTKFEYQAGRLRASRDPRMVNVSSRLMVDRIAARYEAGLREHCRGDLLDLGCGRAPLYIVYRELAGTVTCVDWAASPHDICHADVLCDLNKPIPLPDHSFDTIIFSDVLEHLYRPHEALSEIRRLLRPGGKLLMNVPFMYWLHEQPHDYFRYTQYALARMAEESRLTIVELRPLGGAPEVLADLIAKLSIRVRFFGQPIARSVQSLCEFWSKTPAGERLSNSTARQFPFAYFLIAEAHN